ncbi:MAG: hypothetical protein H6Q66_1004, partial [Firmicutes bacterium]|nr:hypothetical protein [Bacillota bacterium]
ILHREAGSSEPASCIFLQKKETVPIFLIETAPLLFSKIQFFKDRTITSNIIIAQISQ